MSEESSVMSSERVLLFFYFAILMLIFDSFFLLFTLFLCKQRPDFTAVDNAARTTVSQPFPIRKPILNRSGFSVIVIITKTFEKPIYSWDYGFFQKYSNRLWILGVKMLTIVVVFWKYHSSEEGPLEHFGTPK